MPGWRLDEEGFEREWLSLESPARREIARLAARGRIDEDPRRAALIAAYADSRLRPFEPWAVIGAVALGYLALADVFFGGYDPLILVALIGALTVFFSVRRRNLEGALEGNLEVIDAAEVREAEMRAAELRAAEEDMPDD